MKYRRILYKTRRLEANYKIANVSLAIFDGNCFLALLPTAMKSKISNSLFSKHATATVEFQIR